MTYQSYYLTFKCSHRRARNKDVNCILLIYFRRRREPPSQRQENRVVRLGLFLPLFNSSFGSAQDTNALATSVFFRCVEQVIPYFEKESSEYWSASGGHGMMDVVVITCIKHGVMRGKAFCLVAEVQIDTIAVEESREHTKEKIDIGRHNRGYDNHRPPEKHISNTDILKINFRQYMHKYKV